jgi:hypothetical protein
MLSSLVPVSETQSLGTHSLVLTFPPRGAMNSQISKLHSTEPLLNCHVRRGGSEIVNCTGRKRQSVIILVRVKKKATERTSIQLILGIRECAVPQTGSRITQPLEPFVDDAVSEDHSAVYRR